MHLIENCFIGQFDRRHADVARVLVCNDPIDLHSSAELRDKECCCCELAFDMNAAVHFRA